MEIEMLEPVVLARYLYWYWTSVRNLHFSIIEGSGAESSPWWKAMRSSIFTLHLTSKVNAY